MKSAFLLAFAFSLPSLVRAASTTTADGVLVLPVPDGWQIATQNGEQLRLQGPNAFLAIRRPEVNRGLMVRRANDLTDTFVKRVPGCSGGALNSTAMPNGIELVYREVNCPAIKPPLYYFGAFSFGDYVYTVRWHVDVANPFKYGLGVISLLRKADTGTVATGWVKSWEGDVMVPMPAGEWQDFTDTARGSDSTVVAHFTAGTNDITLNRELESDPAGLAALADSEAMERTAALGHCLRVGAGQIGLPNGWQLTGLAFACEGPQGRGTYSFGAFDAKGKGGYSVFGAYDKKTLAATIGAASLASDAKDESKMLPIETPVYRPPPVLGVIALAAVPFVLCILFLLRRRKPVLPVEPDEQPPAPPQA
jgi:hypothetical protein